MEKGLEGPVCSNLWFLLCLQMGQRYPFVMKVPVPFPMPVRASAENHHNCYKIALVSLCRSNYVTVSYYLYDDPSSYSGNSGDIGGAYSPAAWYPPSYPVYYTTDGNILGGQPIYLVPRDSDGK